MDDLAIANTSVERLKSLEVDAIYPGHGQPFSMERFLKQHP
jgi:glyoxylase-like metal-dependent hydrolase (beta-lactamase superfamily II)